MGVKAQNFVCIVSALLDKWVMMRLHKLFIVLIFLICAQVTQELYNYSSAVCHDLDMTRSIDMMMGWTVDSADTGYCYDSKGSGYKLENTISTCSHCMKYTCSHRSVTAWSGRISAKMFWQLTNISSD